MLPKPPLGFLRPVLAVKSGVRGRFAVRPGPGFGSSTGNRNSNRTSHRFCDRACALTWVTQGSSPGDSSSDPLEDLSGFRLKDSLKDRFNYPSQDPSRNPLNDQVKDRFADPFHDPSSDRSRDPFPDPFDYRSVDLCSDLFFDPLRQPFPFPSAFRSRFLVPDPFPDQGLMTTSMGTGAPIPTVRQSGPATGFSTAPLQRPKCSVSSRSSPNFPVKSGSLNGFPLAALEAKALLHFLVFSTKLPGPRLLVRQPTALLPPT